MWLWLACMDRNTSCIPSVMCVRQTFMCATCPVCMRVWFVHYVATFAKAVNRKPPNWYFMSPRFLWIMERPSCSGSVEKLPPIFTKCDSEHCYPDFHMLSSEIIAVREFPILAKNWFTLLYLKSKNFNQIRSKITRNVCNVIHFN